MQEIKPFYKSKTFWVGAAIFVCGIVLDILNQYQAGVSLTLSGMVMMVLRKLTTTPITFTKTNAK